MKLKLLRREKSQSVHNPDKAGRVTAAEMYEVQDSYVRFNEKNHMTSQMFWDANIEAEGKKRMAKQKQLMKKGTPGFDAIGWSLNSAANSLLYQMDFSKNQIDKGATSWQPKLESAPAD